MEWEFYALDSTKLLIRILNFFTDIKEYDRLSHSPKINGWQNVVYILAYKIVALSYTHYKHANTIKA